MTATWSSHAQAWQSSGGEGGVGRGCRGRGAMARPSGEVRSGAVGPDAARTGHAGPRPRRHGGDLGPPRAHRSRVCHPVCARLPSGGHGRGHGRGPGRRHGRGRRSHGAPAPGRGSCCTRRRSPLERSRPTRQAAGRRHRSYRPPVNGSVRARRRPANRPCYCPTRSGCAVEGPSRTIGKTPEDKDPWRSMSL